MDIALEKFQCACTPTEYNDGIKMLHVYIRNIHQNPTIEKYRRIRTGNEKFNANVWRHETCRTVLLLVGFEQVGEFIELSTNADVTLLYNLLQKQLVNVEHSSNDGSTATNTQRGQRNATLSLAASNQGGLFAAELTADLTLMSYMMEMGYSKHASERGLLATKNQGVQPAMDWIAIHPECHIAPEPESTKREMQGTTSLMSPSSSEASSSTNDRPNVTSRLRAANEQKFAYQEKLRLEAIKKAKLEKAEDQIAKKYLKKNLQSERQETKEKFEREKVIRHEIDEQEHQTAASSCTPLVQDENICTLRLKMYNGKMFVWETAKDTSIKDLYSHISSLSGDEVEDFNVCIPRPIAHDVLDSNDETSLQDKGLYPNATVMIQNVLCSLTLRMYDGKMVVWDTAKETSVKDLYIHISSLSGDAVEDFNVCISHPLTHDVLNSNDEASLQDKGLYPKATVIIQKIMKDEPPSTEDESMDTEGTVEIGEEDGDIDETTAAPVQE